MKIIVAPDSFKGSLSAAEAAAAIGRGLAAVWPQAEIILIPMADGGEGTVAALLGILGGRRETVTVRDPFDRPVVAAASAALNEPLNESGATMIFMR